jgi:sporulation protein YlmC with PRC-barrel domain
VAIVGYGIGEESDMRIELGSTVRSADGEVVGTIGQLVIDANSRAVTQIILRAGHVLTHDFLVPLDTVAREDDDNTLHLALSTAQVGALPQFEEENFVVAEHADRTAWRYLVPAGQGGAMTLPSHATISSGRPRMYDPGSGSLFGVDDPTDETFERRGSLSEWEYREGKGTKVLTRDGHTIGALHEVDMDADGRPQQIIVATGLLHRGHRTVPIAQVRSADSHQILLHLTRAAFEQSAE